MPSAGGRGGLTSLAFRNLVGGEPSPSRFSQRHPIPSGGRAKARHVMEKFLPRWVGLGGAERMQGLPGAPHPRLGLWKVGWGGCAPGTPGGCADPRPAARFRTRGCPGW